MFENLIKFKANDKFIKHNQDNLPVPAKLNTPDWFKKLEHAVNNKTVKGCMPFLDSLTAGYILKMPVDYFIEHNIETEGIKNTVSDSSQMPRNALASTVNVNISGDGQYHHIQQLGNNNPLLEKNKNLPVHKILNPWVIETPPGYSTLFVSPLNNRDDRFEIMSGIVDTDIFKSEINFPIIINGDKYETLKTIIKRGTPYVQCIPFKRDRWKMKIEEQCKLEKQENNFFQHINIINDYKTNVWSKKSWK
tara:strand:- start:295 stop:1041 length:747 start_codon:yes stop_codon:yes gene_type:complete